jgi:hypothetical protein
MLLTHFGSTLPLRAANTGLLAAAWRSKITTRRVTASRNNEQKVVMLNRAKASPQSWLNSWLTQAGVSYTNTSVSQCKSEFTSIRSNGPLISDLTWLMPCMVLGQVKWDSFAEDRLTLSAIVNR